jgi:hypothetical protein
MIPRNAEPSLERLASRILVYNGARAFAPSEKIRVIPAAEILTTAGKW